MTILRIPVAFGCRRMLIWVKMVATRRRGGKYGRQDSRHGKNELAAVPQMPRIHSRLLYILWTPRGKNPKAPWTRRWIFIGLGEPQLTLCGRRLTYLGGAYETWKQNASPSWVDDEADVWVHLGMNKLWIMKSCCLKASSCMLESRWPSRWSE